MCDVGLDFDARSHFQDGILKSLLKFMSAQSVEEFIRLLKESPSSDVFNPWWEVDKENDKNRTVYEVDLEKGSDKMKVHFDENGKAVKAKGRVGGEKVKSKEKSK